MRRNDLVIDKLMNNEEIIMATYRTVLSKRSIIYCSMPITDGKEMLNWFTSTNHELDNTESYLEFIRRNKKYANALVKKIRAIVTSPVINPIALTRSLSDDYSLTHDENDSLNLWVDVIKKYAHTVVFANGWEYSFLSVNHFLVAQSNCIDCSDENLKIFGIIHGTKLIRKAIAVLKEKGLQDEAFKIEDILTSLQSLKVPDHYSALYSVSLNL